MRSTTINFYLVYLFEKYFYQSYRYLNFDTEYIQTNDKVNDKIKSQIK